VRRARTAAEISNTSGPRILIVDDDLSLARFLTTELLAQNFLVDQAHDGELACRLLETERRYDLLILELSLPKLDGMSLIARMRPALPRLPMLVLTARCRVEDKVMALRTGADDFVAKPFSLMELLARVRVLMRRNTGMVPNCSSIGDLVFYREERRVERKGRKIELTPREFAILDVLMRNAGRPVSRATLLEQVWNTSSEPATNIVDVYMKYVRDKIDHPGESRLMHTVRGIGYALRLAEELPV
jgi:DNA-binding response OmpR family regulator